MDGRRSRVIAVPAVVGAAQRAELDADQRLVAVAGAKRLADQHLVVAHPVKVARVEQRHAGVERRVDRRDRLRLVGGAVRARHAHAAEPDRADRRAAGSERAQPQRRRVSTASSTASAIARLPAAGTCSSPVGRHDRDLVAIGVEAEPGLGDVVADDRVEALASELLPRACEPALAVLGGEPDERLAVAAASGQPGEDVGRRLELERQRALTRDLPVGDLVRAVVRDGGAHHEDVGRVEFVLACRRELGGAADVHVADRRVALERDVRRHDDDLGSACRRGVGEREPHPPRGAVAEEAHRVDRLARAAGGDQRPRTGPGPRAQVRLDGGKQRGGLGQAPDPGLAVRRETAARRDEHVDPALAQRRDVRLGRRVFPHPRVHRRRDDHRAARDERACGQERVRLALGELRDRVRRGRGDQEHVGRLGEREMPGRVVRRDRIARVGPAQRIALEGPGEDRRAAQRGERRGADEAVCGRRLDDTHGEAGLRRQAHNLERLVGGDSTAHAEQQPRHVRARYR